MSKFSREVKNQATILGSFVAIFWILEIIDQFVFKGALDRFGIIPHNFMGLRGILLAPFLHGGFTHLIANTIPFLTLGWLVMLQETSDFFIVTIITMLVGGLGVWLFAPPASIHIGASILIFGYLGFLLFRGFFQRNLPSIFLSLIVGFLYGGLVWGVFPSQPGISWQGHLFGFLGGVIAARMIAKKL
ncbi:MAG: rhomboid family intramembrane serine protease [Gomphosphaeria aponina SAG 52.96 = DSM 107014]|uniref:Rhomboid family intramembrane serine protease n=1 Tax=Gomphosphaeria aponina SAG 52.96 = DSM 107014 TaxID=1521640 RepID=A0A941GQ99_9CHRO|nr:rhomboid family intramembrane serine protease [Gomphosphaeria aponina SAG 52.96 = DSM 107014]